MSNEKLDQNTLISILGEVHEEKPFIETRLDEKENFKNAMGNIFQQNASIQPKIVTPDPAKNSANNNPSILSSANMGNATSILGETTGSKSFMAMTADEKKKFKNAMGNIFQQKLPIQPKIVTPDPAKNSANNNPSILSSAKMGNATSVLGETTGSKSFMAMTAAEKENFKNAMGNIFQQNPSIQPKIVTSASAKNSANNNPSVLSSAKMENPTSILGETTGSKSFMAMTATEKEIFKNAMGNIFLKNLPIHQTTVIPVPITKESSETKPSDQGEHRRKFVDVLNQIKLNNPVAQERTAESAKKEFTENTSLILPSEEKSGQEGKTGSLNQLTSQTKKTGGVPLSKSTYVNNIRDLQNNPIYQRIARQLSNEEGNNGKFNNGEVENGKVDNGRLSNGQKKELRVILGDCGTQVVKIDSQSERPTASPNLVSRVNNPKGAVGYDR
ncbi:hypothetical protein ABQD69_10185 [Enterococcus hirae]|uniref:hypothetical protein n=1 Tax=Enterococcus hirae TaxID=1354 RepID=UPI0032E3DB62